MEFYRIWHHEAKKRDAALGDHVGPGDRHGLVFQLSFFAGGAAGMLFSAACLGASAYWAAPWLAGNLAMPLRSSLAEEGPFPVGPEMGAAALLLAGLIYADIGWVRWNGRILGHGPDFPEGTGLFLEKPSFLDRYSGKQNLELLGGLKGVSGEDIEKILEDVGLWEARDKKYRKYSLGMKQRLGIGAALLGEPRLLLLDEPLNAIDQKSMGYFCELFLRERDRGAIVVLVSHDAGLLDLVCDRKYLMEGGRIRLETEE